MEISALQARVWANKLAKGFSTDINMEFNLLVAEIGEAFTAWRKHDPDYPAELADVAIFLLSLAQLSGYDLGEEIEKKMAINENRVYIPDENGTLIRVSG